MKLKNLLLITLVSIALIVIFQNHESVTTDFLFFSVKMPLFMTLFVTLLMGVVIGYITGAKSRKTKS